MHKKALLLVVVLFCIVSYASALQNATFIVHTDGISVTKHVSADQVIFFSQQQLTINNISVEQGQTILLAGDVIEYTMPYTQNLLVDFIRYERTPRNIRISLPPGHSLIAGIEHPQPSITPRPRSITSDGERITFHWYAQDIEPAKAIFMQFHAQQVRSNLWIYLFVLALVMTALVLLFFVRQTNKGVTKHLYGEEKQIVELLLRSPGYTLWQNKIVYELGISKVKISRRLASLEKKGYIEKEPYQNSNKIRLLRK